MASGLLAVIADLLVKSLGLAVFFLVGYACLRRARPAVRSAWLQAGVAALLVLPFLSVALPQWTLRVMPAVVEAKGGTMARSGGAPGGLSGADGRREGEAGESGRGTAVAAEMQAGGGAAVVPGGPSVVAKDGPGAGGIVSSFQGAGGEVRRALVRHWREIVVAAYVGGMVVCLLKLGRSLVWVFWWKHSARPVEDVEVLGLASRVGEKMGLLRRRVKLAVSAWASVPMVVGWLTPAVVIPAAFLRRANRGLLEAALHHELAHIGRWDLWWAVLERVVTSVYWPNVAAWAIAVEMKKQRELACDDWCMEVLGESGDDYAGNLGRIALMARAEKLPSIIAGMASVSAVEWRLDRLAARVGSGEARVRRWQWGMLLAGALIFAGLVAPGQIGRKEAKKAEGRVIEVRAEELAGALLDLRPGDMVLVDEGGAEGGLRLRGLGRRDAPITIRAKNDKTVFRGGEIGLLVEESEWVVIEGLKFIGAEADGIRLVESDNCTVRGVVCGETGRVGIALHECDNVVVEECEIYGTEVSHGIRVAGGCDYVEIRNNRIDDVACSGIMLNGYPGLPGGDGIISFAVIEGNTLSRNGARYGGAAINATNVQDSVISNNLIYKNHAGGIAFFEDIEAGPEVINEGNQIVGNTVYFGPGEGRFSLKLCDGCRDFVVTGNIFQGGRSGTVCVTEDSFEGLVMDYNVVGTYEGHALLGEGFPADEDSFFYTVGQWRYELGLGRHSKLGVEPGFVNVERDDYRLRQGSPAVDAGGEEMGRYCEVDIKGARRPSRGGFDCGAYEMADGGAGEAEARVVAADTSSFGELAKDLRAGDTLLLADGQYEGGQSLKLRGRRGGEITIRAKGGGTVFRGGLAGLTLEDSSWVVLEGLGFESSAMTGVALINTENCRVRGCVVNEPQYYGIYVDGSRGLVIEGNEVSESGKHGICVLGESRGAVVRGNRVHDSAACGIYMDTYTMEGSVIMGAVIEGNVLWGNGDPLGGAAINLSNVRESVVRNNLLYGNHKGGIVFYDGDAGSVNEGNRVVGNTVYFGRGEGLYCLKMTDNCRDFEVRNNIFWGGRSGTVSVMEEAFAGLKMDNNVVGNHERGIVFGERWAEVRDGFEYTALQWREEFGFDRGSVIGVEPEFVSIEEGDYRLAAGSAGIDAGADMGVLCAKDIAGARRPMGGGFDVGCYEYWGTGTVGVAQSKEEGAGYFELQIVDAGSGAGLGGAVVKVRMDEEVARVETDEQGVCVVEVPGRDLEYFRVAAHKEGFAPKSVTWEGGGLFRAPRGYVLKMEKGKRIGGRVVDESGNAIEGVKALVTAESGAGVERSVLKDHVEKTDGEGRWECNSVPREAVRVRITFEHEYYADDSPIDMAGGDVPGGAAVEKVLRRKLKLAGQVRDTNGGGLRAFVQIGRDSFGEEGRVVRTGDDGRFIFSDMGPQVRGLEEAAVLTVQAEGYVTHAEKVQLSDEMEPIEVVMERDDSLGGRYAGTGTFVPSIRGAFAP